MQRLGVKRGIAQGVAAARRYADASFMLTFRFAANETIVDPEIAADLRPSADGSAVRTSLVAGGG